MKSVIISILLLAFSTSLFCKDDSDHTNTPNGQRHAIGAGGTIYSTWGFAYRHHFANRLGVAATLGGFLKQSYGHIGNSIGLTYTVAHHEFDWSWLPNSSTRVYFIGYLANIIRRDDRYYHKDETVHKEWSWEPGLGIGPGIEFFFNSYFAVHLEIPWMTFVKVTKEVRFRDSQPHVGGGFVYYF